MEISYDDKLLLNDFFSSFKDEKNFYVENIKIFRSNLENYIYKNNLGENLVFNLFLNEIRNDELFYFYKKKKGIFDYNVISDIIRKWYEKSIIYYDDKYPMENESITRK